MTFKWKCILGTATVITALHLVGDCFRSHVLSTEHYEFEFIGIVAFMYLFMWLGEVRDSLEEIARNTRRLEEVRDLLEEVSRNTR
jgi:hypothetical protein